MLLRALHTRGFLDIGSVAGEPKFSKTLSPGQTVEIEDKYAILQNIVAAIDAGLLEIVSYGDGAESDVTQFEFDTHVNAANPHSGSASTTSLTTHTSAANPHSGSASTASLTAHTSAANPHSGSASTGNLTAHTSAANPHSGSASTGDLTAHTGAASPHTGHVIFSSVSSLPVSSQSATTIYSLTQVDNTAKAPVGLYTWNGNGWICIHQYATYPLTLSGAVTTVAIPGVEYAVTLNGNITSLVVNVASIGTVLFKVTNGSSYSVVDPTNGSRTVKIRTDTGADDLATALCEWLVTDDGTHQIWSAVELVTAA